MRQPKIKPPAIVPPVVPVVPGLPDDAKKPGGGPGGGYAEETQANVAKMPLADNSRARAELNPVPIEPDPPRKPVRALVVVPKKGRPGR